MNRRLFVQTACVSGIGAGIALPLWAQENPSKFKPTNVPSGQDRLKEQHNIGVSDTTFKVLSGETGGNLFVMEQSNHKKGGPPSTSITTKRNTSMSYRATTSSRSTQSASNSVPVTPSSRLAKSLMHGHSSVTIKDAF